MSAPIQTPGVPSIEGREVLQHARVGGESRTAALHALPDRASDVLRQLRYNDRVFVILEIDAPAGWAMVATDDQHVGYVERSALFVGPPEPDAVLHRVAPGQSAQQIARQYYSDAVRPGQDERFFVNVLVYANWSDAGERRGIHRPRLDDSWETTQTREGYYIWVPSLEFARTLEGQVSAGSFGRDLWNSVVRTAEGAWEWFKFGAGFVGGLIHGALRCVWDTLVGIFDLIGMVWDIVRLIFSGEVLSKARELWNALSLDAIQRAVQGMWNDFLSKWNHPSSLRRGHFRGFVVGYVIAAAVLTFFTLGAAAAALTGRLGAFVRLVRSIGPVRRVLDVAGTATNRMGQGAARAQEQLRRALREWRRRRPSGDRAPDGHGQQMRDELADAVEDVADEVEDAFQQRPDRMPEAQRAALRQTRADEIRRELDGIEDSQRRFEAWQALTDAERQALEEFHRAAALRARRWDLERRKGDQRRLDSEAAQEAARAEAIRDALRRADRSSLTPDEQAFLRSQRNQELAIDLDGNGGFRVAEARAALRAEREGILPGPVRRATSRARPQEQGADIIDGRRVPWDIKEARMGAEDIARTANGGENVLVDAEGLSAAALRTLHQDVQARLRGGTGRVEFVPRP